MIIQATVSFSQIGARKRIKEKTERDDYGRSDCRFRQGGKQGRFKYGRSYRGYRKLEIIGKGLEVIGNAAVAWATAFGFIYVVGILSKTFLIFMDKAKIEDFKNWFKFWEKTGL